jgi:hypothetical protein
MTFQNQAAASVVMTDELCFPAVTNGDKINTHRTSDTYICMHVTFRIIVDYTVCTAFGHSWLWWLGDMAEMSVSNDRVSWHAVLPTYTTPSWRCMRRKKMVGFASPVNEIYVCKALFRITNLYSKHIQFDNFFLVLTPFILLFLIFLALSSSVFLDSYYVLHQQHCVTAIK